MYFKMTLGCCTIDDRKDHVQYPQFQIVIPDDCTCSLTEKNIGINYLYGIKGINKTIFV